MNIPVKEWLWPNLSSFITTLLVLAFTYWLFKKYLFAPTRKFLDQRQKYITKHIKSAENKEQEAIEKLQQAQTRLDKTVKDSAKYLDLQMKEAKVKASTLLESTKKDIENLKANTKQSLKLAENKAKENLREEVATLSIAAASKILRKEVDEKTSEKLVADFIKDIK